MKNSCCVCGEKAEGLITYGEFVCFKCHEEATGEKPKLTSDHKRRGLHKRHRVTNELIMDNLINRLRKRC